MTQCKQNPDHEYVPVKKEYAGPFGEPMETEICFNCENESRMEYRNKIESANEVDVPEMIEEYEKMIQKTTPDEKVNENDGKRNLINEYSYKLHDIIGAPEEACKAIVQFDISVALHRLFFADGKGRVLPNLGFMWIAPSGADKTPIYNWGIMSMQEKIFKEWGYIHYNRVGGKALISSVSKVKDNQIQNGRILTLITQDEVSTLAKESNSDGLSDVFEAFAQAYDGQLSSSETVIRGTEKPRPIYSPMWFQGTPVFLKYVSDDFWDIGLGNRIFFVKYETSEVREISKTLHAKEFYDEYLLDLGKLRELEKADFSDEAWDTYNKYQMEIMRSVQSVQNDLESSVESTSFSITSKVKFPIQIIKMAIVIASSKFHFDENILHVENDDVLDAIKEIEKYHNNMIYVHSIWETQSAQRLKHESIELLAKKISNHMKHLRDIGKCYRIELKKNEGEFLAIPDKKGMWVRHSDLLKHSHMKAVGLRSFNEIIETLIERDEIVSKECSVGLNTKNKTMTTSIFYKVREIA